MGEVGIFLSIFFLGVVIFGILIIFYLRKFRKEVSTLASDLHIEGYFSNELRFFTWAMVVGTLSFVFILAGWILLSCELSKGELMQKPQPNNSFQPTPR